MTAGTASGDRESTSIDEDIFQLDDFQDSNNNTQSDALPIIIKEGDFLEQCDSPLCYESIPLKEDHFNAPRCATISHVENTHFLTGSSNLSAVNFSEDKPNLSNSKNIARSLPDLLSLDGDDVDTPPSISKASKFLRKVKSKPTIKKQSQKNKRKTSSGQPPHSPDTIVKKYSQWQCAGCQQVNQSDKVECQGCRKACGFNAIAESFCKSCKLKVFVPSIDKLLDTSCPNCEGLLESTKLK